MAGPSAEELELLPKFRACLDEMGISLEAHDSTDLRLLSWLRAQDHKVPAAANMLKKSLEWRKDYGASSLLNWEAPSGYATTHFKYEINGRDVSGKPILILKLGLWDVRRAVVAGEKDEYVKYMTQIFERLQAALRKATSELGDEVSQVVAIVDCDNFAYRQLMSIATINAMLEVVKIFEANYPEILSRAYFINSSRIWMMVFELLKPMMSKTTAERIKMFSSPDQWKPQLHQNFPQEYLPKEYGGLY